MRHLALVLVLVSPAAIAAPVRVTHSGYLIGAGDTPVTQAQASLTFSLWSDASSTNDAAHRVWPAPPASAATCLVDVTAGYFAVSLGDGTCGTGLGSEVFGDPLWLQISVGGVALVPRTALNPAPAASRALDADKLEGRSFAALRTELDGRYFQPAAAALPVSDGGTGARTASLARQNLGLGALALADFVDDTRWVGTSLAVAHGGTGATTAATARQNLGLGAISTLDTVGDALWAGPALSISHGGTGATSASAALSALSPLTTKGDLLVQGVSSAGRLGVGTPGQVLTANPAAPSGVEWTTPSSSSTFEAQFNAVATCPAGSLGKFCVRNDGGLFFHDGTGWKRLQVASSGAGFLPTGINATDVLNSFAFDGNTTDAGVNGSSSTLAGALSWTVGRFTQAASGFSISNGVDVTRITLSSRTGTGLTLSAWVKGTNTSSTTSTCSTANNIFGDTNGAVWIAWGVRGGKIAAEGCNNLHTGSVSVADGQWHHLAFVHAYSGGTWSVALYVDGVADGGGTLSASGNANYGVNAIGRTHSSYAQVGGYAIDEARIFAKTFSAAQVLELYQSSL